MIKKVTKFKFKRFSTENCQFQLLNPQSENFLFVESVEEFGKVFDSNMEDLKHEVPQAKRLLQCKLHTLVIDVFPRTIQ